MTVSPEHIVAAIIALALAIAAVWLDSVRRSHQGDRRCDEDRARLRKLEEVMRTMHDYTCTRPCDVRVRMDHSNET